MANLVVNTFVAGGWVMWPILGAFLLALCVILERAIWWLRLRAALRPALQEKVREALGKGEFERIWQLAKEAGNDPYLDNLVVGAEHTRTSMLAAMQLDATHLIEKAEARMWVLSTLITLAPLLGLFGTVIGIMSSFSFMGDETRAAAELSGGIGEALIATACGIGIAMFCLLPYNFLRRQVSLLRGSLERWINHAELLVQAARAHGHDLEEHLIKRMSR
ncbi:MAG TPA: MotA/TolQ/ExbB proton channel family protein [Luteolibacter sp.]|nr:MotA/TolQ/ExbB proton channel family protein [Luteolibacter sp.]